MKKYCRLFLMFMGLFVSGNMVSIEHKSAISLNFYIANFYAMIRKNITVQPRSFHAVEKGWANKLERPESGFEAAGDFK